MKIKNLLISLGLVLSVGAGIGTALAVKDNVKEAKATTPSTIYFKWTGTASSTWGGYYNEGLSRYVINTDIYAHFYDASTEPDTDKTTWPGIAPSDAITVNGDVYNEYTVPAGSDHVIFNINFWGGDSNKTVDLEIPVDYNNCFVPTSLGGGVAGSGFWTEFDEDMPDGVYLRGKYHGAEPNWSSNIVLSDEKVDESITFDSVKNEAYSVLDLHAGDFFKFYRFYNGLSITKTTFSIESSDSEYYPVAWEGNNVKVTNDGIYYVKMGYGSNEHANECWYYVDNSASAFATEFLGSMTCDNNGIEEPDFKDGYSWTYFSSWYSDTLDEYAKTTLFTADSNDKGTNIEKCVSRYLTIMQNHGTVNYPPFITNAAGTATRTSVRTPSAITVNDSLTSNTTLILIIASSMVTLLAIGGYFFLRKRKEDR